MATKELGMKEKEACRQYANDHPKCTVGDVIDNVFGEMGTLERATITLMVVSFLLQETRKGDE